MAWILLVVAGLLEVVWAAALKQSGGFRHLWPSAIGVGAVPGWKAFAIARRRDGIVILTNSDRGTRVIVPMILDTYAAAAPIFEHIGWHLSDR